MKKIIIISLFSIFMVSCVAPYGTYDCDTPRYTHYPHVYHPTRVIIVKQKHKRHNKSNKRHVKVKINKHRKTK